MLLYCCYVISLTLLPLLLYLPLSHVDTACCSHSVKLFVACFITFVRHNHQISNEYNTHLHPRWFLLWVLVVRVRVSLLSPSYFLNSYRHPKGIIVGIIIKIVTIQILEK